VTGKLHNYRQLLLRSARDATGTRQTRLRDIAERHAVALADLGKATALPEVLGIEGHAARDYFQGLELLAPGVNLVIDYGAGDEPVLPVRLQEMFGAQDTPTVAGGRSWTS